MNATNLTDAEKAKVLREAYRKLAQSLHDIEETQVKLTAVLLAILGAGATFIAGARQPIVPWRASWSDCGYYRHSSHWVD